MRTIPYRETPLTAVILAAIGLGAFCVQCVDYFGFTVDDVFISIRYAENVLRGYGYVYNAGEYVEGFSNWLWINFLILAGYAGGEPARMYPAMAWIAKWASTGFACLNLYLIHRLGGEFLPADSPRILRAVPFLLAATSGAFVLWGVAGMETQMCATFYLLALLASVAILRRAGAAQRSPGGLHLLAGLAWSGALLTRPEAVLHAAVASLFLTATLERAERLRHFVYAILPAALVFGGFLIWRYATYHAFLPNPFFSKVYFTSAQLLLAVKYALGGIAFLSGPALLFMAAGFFGRKEYRPARRLMLLMLACTLLFVFMSGGDWMPLYRFFIPVFGVIAALAADGLARVSELIRNRDFAATASPAAVLLLILLLAGGRVSMDRFFIRSVAPDLTSGFHRFGRLSLPEHADVAEWLAARTARPILVATGEAGLIGWRNMNMRLIDCNGLMDLRIARERRALHPFPSDYVLDRHPDFVILPANRPSEEAVGETESRMSYVRALQKSERFARSYFPVYRTAAFTVYQSLHPSFAGNTSHE